MARINKFFSPKRYASLIITLLVSILILLTFLLFIKYKNPTINNLNYEGLSKEADSSIWRSGESKSNLYFLPEDFDLEMFLDKKKYEKRVYFPKNQPIYKQVWQSRRIFKYPFLHLKEGLLKNYEALIEYYKNISQKNITSKTFDKNTNFLKPESTYPRLNNFHIFLDAGHGGKDPGALSPFDKSANKNFAEKHLTLDLSSKIATLLRKYGISVTELRDKDEFLSIYYRPAKVALATLEQLVEILEKELVFLKNTSNKILDLEERYNYFSAILTTLKEKTIPYYKPLLREIMEQNRDDFGGIFGGLGASYQAQFLLELQSSLPNNLFISIHINADLRPEIRGTQAYLLRNSFVFLGSQEALTDKQELKLIYDSLTKKESDEKKLNSGKQAVYPHFLDYDTSARSALAKSMYQAVKRRFPTLESQLISRLKELYFAVLRTISFDSVLYETAYISNEDDFNILKDEKNRIKLSEALTDGILAYYRSFEFLDKIK